MHLGRSREAHPEISRQQLSLAGAHCGIAGSSRRNNLTHVSSLRTCRFLSIGITPCQGSVPSLQTANECALDPHGRCRSLARLFPQRWLTCHNVRIFECDARRSRLAPRPRKTGIQAYRRKQHRRRAISSSTLAMAHWRPSQNKRNTQLAKRFCWCLSDVRWMVEDWATPKWPKSQITSTVRCVLCVYSGADVEWFMDSFTDSMTTKATATIVFHLQCKNQLGRNARSNSVRLKARPRMWP